LVGAELTADGALDHQGLRAGLGDRRQRRTAAGIREHAEVELGPAIAVAITRCTVAVARAAVAVTGWIAIAIAVAGCRDAGLALGDAERDEGGARIPAAVATGEGTRAKRDQAGNDASV